MTTPDEKDAEAQRQERGARFLSKLVDGDPARLDVATDEDVDRQMDAAGVRVDRVPGADELLARAERRAAAREPSGVRAASAPRRRWSVPAMAAGMAAALVLVLLLMNRRALFPPRVDVPIGPDLARTGPTPPPSPSERAAPIRDHALAACGMARYDECAAELDQAAAIDPAGEKLPAVLAARQAIAAARQPEFPPKTLPPK